MAARRPLLTVLFVVAVTLPCGSGLGKQPLPHRIAHSNPLAIIVDAKGETAFVALHGANTVAVVDLKAGKVVQQIPVDDGPYDLAATAETVYVSCARGDSVAVIDRAKKKVRHKVAIGQEPRGIAVDDKNQRVFVACHDEQALCWFDNDKGPIRRLELPGFPDRIGSVAKLPGIVALARRGGEVIQLTISTNQEPAIAATMVLKNASNARGISSPGNAGIVVAHQRPRNKVPATQIAQGWVFTNGLTLSREWERPWANIVLDEPQRGFADPSDVVCSPDQTRLYVASGGTDTVAAIDAVKLITHTDMQLKALAKNTGHGDYQTRDLPDDLTANRQYVLARLAVQANPRRLAISGDGQVLVVSNYLGDSLTLIDTDKLKVLRHIPLGGPGLDAARRGEILFNSAKMTFTRQFTCASCHPNGDNDGLNWDLPRDGIGNFLNTRSLFGVKDTAPYGWHGTSPTLADRVSGTLRTLHHHEPTQAEITDIVAYLQMLAPPRPLPQAADSKAVRMRGKALFQGKGQCAKCHRGEALDDDVTHDVGTRGPGDIKAVFDTPSLRGVARTAPYLHDGRSATVEEVFSKHNPQHRHGAAHLLSTEEMKDLLEFLGSL
jgi:YVTN family beta-propeller protein